MSWCHISSMALGGRSALLALVVAAVSSSTSDPLLAGTVNASIEGFEAEHLSVLEPVANRHWTAPVLRPDAAGHLFAWRISVVGARNVSQVSAVLTLTAVDRPRSQPIVCHPATSSDLRVICGGAAEFATTYAANLEVVLRVSTTVGSSAVKAAAQGWFIQGLNAEAKAKEGGWGGAEWIGVASTNDTASQFRAVANVHSLGFAHPDSVARATLFVAGLGGFRASVNDRPIDPTAVRASVTEWHNRTFYWADDVTADLAAAAGANGNVVIAVELFKHWYGMSNNFYPVPYGPRSLKAVLVLTDRNGTDTFAIPTSTLTNTSSGSGRGWHRSSGSAIFDDLHGGQQIDGRNATPGWESSDYITSAPAWLAPVAVTGPPGELMPHPMPRSRVLELVRPVDVRLVNDTCGGSTGPGDTYLFELPYEVGGFCTLLLPRGSPAGTRALVRHGSTASAKDCLKEVCGVPRVNEHTTYTCRGDATGMGSHEANWRRLVVGGNTSSTSSRVGPVFDDPELEAFTPAFQYTSFKFIAVTYAYDGAAKLPRPDESSMACYRVGVGFDWTGDVQVEGPPPASASATASAAVASNVPQRTEVARCGRVAENDNLTVGCAGGATIDKIIFASFGTTAGNCTAGFNEGICSSTGQVGSANRSLVVLEQACIGKASCVVPATVTNFAGDGHTGQTCPHVKKSLAAEVHCSGGLPGASCAHSCYDDSAPTPSPPPSSPTPNPSPGSVTTPAERFNAVVAAGRSAAICNYVFDVPTDQAQGEKRGWLGDSLAVHRMLAAFFDMRAAWIKWSDDMVFTSSLLKPAGTILSKAPCVFEPVCPGDPRKSDKPLPNNQTQLTGVMWGSNMPQLSAFTAKLTADGRFASRVAKTAGQYVALLQSYANTASYEYPMLLNVSDDVDWVNRGKKGWPASAYGDWCPYHGLGEVGSGCVSMSALLNSVYFILDADAALSLVQPPDGASRNNRTSASAGAGAGAATGGPSEAQLMSWVTSARESFLKAFLTNITIRPPASAQMPPFSGLAFRDLYPPNVTSHKKLKNNPPTAQGEMASGMAAVDVGLRQMPDGGAEVLRPALADMLAALVKNISSAQTATIDGGIVDTAHLARSLIRYGQPQAAFDLLSADGPSSYFSMSTASGTLGDNNHVMRGGSIGEAVFGIGGIQPAFDRGSDSDSGSGSGSGKRLGLAPVPWLPDAPRGAAVWRTLAGVAAVSWAASTQQATGRWQLWVNTSIPAGGGGADVKLMLPELAQPTNVCVWECGLAGAISSPAPAAAFESRWLSFDGSGGHHQFRAVVPSQAAAGPNAAPDTSACSSVWHSGAAAQLTALGVESVDWVPILPGRTAFPALAVGTTSGSYAFFARPCGMLHVQ